MTKSHWVRFLAALGAAGLLVASAGVASAAPSLNITSTNCTIQKIGGQYYFSAAGSYQAASSANVDYKVNAYSATAVNNGGQKLSEIPYTAIAPTALIQNQTLWSQWVDYSFASALKKVTFKVYNGGKVKGSADAQCQRVGW